MLTLEKSLVQLSRTLEIFFGHEQLNLRKSSGRQQRLKTAEKHSLQNGVNTVIGQQFPRHFGLSRFGEMRQLDKGAFSFSVCYLAHLDVNYQRSENCSMD